MILKRIFLFLILVSALFVSNISAQQIYTNGSLSTGGLNASAASAPTGFNWSELQVPNGTNGIRADIGFARLADNFTVTCGPWTVSKFVFYAFCEFNNQISVSPFNQVRVAVYNGNPATGGTLMYGDTTTNRFSSSSKSNLYRIQNGVRDTTREIWKVEATLNIPSLANGEYWVVYNLGYINQNTVPLPTSSGIQSFVPASTIVGSATQDGNNALFKNTFTAAPWAAVTDNGGPQDLPFDIKYTTPACTSIPTGVVTNSTANTVCSAVPFTLSLGACIGSGATYQWQYKVGSGAWTNIAGATNNILSTTISATSRATAQFRASLYCPGDGESIPPSSGFSNSITINLDNDCYCIPPTSNSRLNDKITNVTFGGINNNSDTSLNGYSNYTTPVVAAGNIFSGIDNPISVKVGPGGTEYVGVWIDYNQNSIFEASEFKLLGSGNGVTISNTISVPVTALTGLTRMRVRVSFSRILSGTEACTAFQTVQGYGETEDYSVNITAAVACNTVNLNTFGFTTSSTLDSVCTAESFTLTASSPTQSLAGISGIKYQWQSSATGNINDFNDILNDTLITRRGTQSSATYYRLKITCTLSSTTVFSASKYIRMKSSLYCYCVPSSNGADNDIALNVTFGGINNSSGSALNGNGYSDYTSTVTRGVAFRNTNNPISVKINTYWTERVAVWIDYDRSGTFDNSEFTFVGSNTGTAIPSTIVLSNNVAIPNTALLGLTRMRVRVVFSSTPTGNDACTTYTFGEAEDYLVDIRDLINCSGAPSIGTISSTSNTSCAGDSVILRVSNSDTLTGTTGLAIQWLSSPTINGVYAPIAGATSPIYTATITAETYFKLQVTCSNGGVTSTSQTGFKVSLTPSTQCYCTSIAGLSNNSDITNVTVGTIGSYAINNASDCNSTALGQGSVANLYSNYTTLPADTIYSGASNPFSVTLNSCVGTATSAIAIWIDLNKNGVFDASEKLYVSPTSSSTYPNTTSGNLDIPATLTPGGTDTISGITRLRIVNTATSTPSSITACGSYTYGETEDYLVNIQKSNKCTGAFVPVIVSTDDSICSGVNFTLSVDNIAGISGVNHQWQSSTTSVNGPFTNIVGATSSTYTGSQSVATWYRDSAFCTASSSPNYSNVKQVKASVICYCTPPASTASALDVISNVSFGGITNPTGASTASPYGYTNYSSSVSAGVVNRGGKNPISITAGTQTQGVAVWIDFNRDQTFEASEYVSLGTTSTTINDSINIPLTALTGITRMRIRSQRTSVLPAANACAGVTFGETEDYSINIVNCPAVTINTQPSNANIACSSPASFIVAATATGTIYYRWQVRTTTNGNWSDVVNGAVYSGANTAQLNISPSGGIPISYNGYSYRVLVNSACIVPDTSQIAGLFVTPSVITSFTAQPSDVLGACASTASFSFAVTTGASPKYKWQFRLNSNAQWLNVTNNATFSGDSTTTLTVNNLSNSYTGYQFRAYATGTCATTDTTNAATLTVNPVTSAVTIVSDADSNRACKGKKVTFTATPSNSSVISSSKAFTWFIANIAKANATSSGTTINVASTEQLRVGSNFPLTVYSGNGSFVSGTYVVSKTSISFVVSTAPIVALTSGSVIAQQLQSDGTLTFADSTYADSSIFYCTYAIASASGCVTPNPAISNTLKMRRNDTTRASITITSSAGSTICSGRSVTFSATQSQGAASLYDWYIGSSFVTRSATYVTDTLKNNQVITCRWTPTDFCASPTTAVSNAITMTVNTTYNVSDTITSSVPPTSGVVSICSGTSVTFTSIPTNGGVSPAYQWLKNGVAILNETNATYTTTTLTNGNLISCKLTSSYGCTIGSPDTSNVISITITSGFTPSVTLSNPAVCAGSSAVYKASPTNGGAGPLYTFYKNGSLVQGPSAVDSLITSPNASDVIKVKLTSNLSCANPDSAIASVTADVKTLPSTPTAGNNSGCNAQSVTLTATPGAGETIDWYAAASGGSALTTASLTYTIPSLTATVTYYAQARNTTTGCISSSRAVVIATLTSGNSGALLAGTYTIGGSGCTDFATLDTIIKYLNASAMKGNITIQVPAGYTETAPTGGYALGSTRLNDSSKSYRIKFVKFGSGSNPKIKAYVIGTATNTSATPDGIWSLRGIDNVTIDGIDLTDSSANSGNALMEYGYGLFKLTASDGAQRDTIKNCVVTLNRNNITGGTAPMVDGSAGIIVLNSLATNATNAITPTLASGSNSFNAFYRNTIQNCNTGIALIGYLAPSPYILADTLNDVGGNSSSLGNTIKNFGGGAGATGTAVAVRANNQRAINISYNTINNNDGAGVNHGGSNLRGIQGENGAASTGTNVTINQNKITLVGSAAATNINGIDNAMGGSSVVNPNQTININNNYVTGGNGSATSGTFTGILNSSVCYNLNMNYDTVQNTTLSGSGAWNGLYVSGANCVNVNLNNNLIDNNNIASTGTSFAPIFTPAVVTSSSLSNNTIKGNTKLITGSGTYSLLNFSATSANCTTTINGNTITDNTVTLTSSGAFTLNCMNAASCLSITANNNVIRINGVNLAINATNAVTINGYKDLSSGTVTASNNTIRRLFISTLNSSTSSAQNTIYGITSFPPGASSSTKNIYSNKIDSLYTNGSYSAVIAGINNSSGSSVNIYKNKIHSLLPGYYSAIKTYAVGIRLQTMPNSTSNIYNNMISIDYANNLGISGTTANAVNNGDGMKGIELPATASTNAYYNVYNNTIRMQGTGTTLFGSTGIYHFANSTSTTGRLRLMNNIISNETTVQGAAIVTAIRRSNANTFVNWSIDTTNNNSLFAGTPSATNLIYYDSTNSYSSLTDYKNAISVTPRDANSISVKPVFISSIDLHLDSTNATNSAFDSTGAKISNFTSAYTDDYDGETRNSLKPDMGADEFNINISCIAGSWLGTVSTDWNTSGNWCSNTIPDGNTNISFAAGKPNYPVITNTTTPICNNITIANGASVRLGVGGKLKINGTIANTGSGAIDATNGTIEMAASTIPSKSFKNNNVRNLIIANNVTLSDTLNILGRLSFSGSNRTFATAGLLNLKSSDSLTASVYRIDRDISGGTISGNTITGDVYVERYISSRKAWRFLSMPTTHNLQFVKAAWQEGATSVSSNPKAGYGMKISDNRLDWSSNGFDSYASSGPTIKYLNLNNWVGIPSTNAYKFELGKGYMTYINGDRGVNFPSVSATILREKGALNIGDVTVDLSSPLQTAGPYYLGLGNPYASAITLKNLTQSGLEKNYWVWDPKLSGTSSSGAYALISVDVNGNISVNPSGNGGSYVQNNYVESGSGFIVKTAGASAQSNVNVTFKESDKIDSNFLVTRTAPLKSFRTNLYEAQNGQTYLVDGVLNLFDDNYSNAIDAYDATKFTNPGENISVSHYNQNFSIERRRDLQNTDTIQYSVSRMKVMSYKFDFIPERMDEMNTNAYLFDKYLNTKTPISLSESSSIEFNVTSEAASYASNRFAILFEGNKPLPVSFVSIQATKKDNHVAVLWTVENEINIDQYVIEHSSDGKNFTSFATLKASGINQYQIADENPFGTVSYYRVKALDKNAGYNYSRVVKVSTDNLPIVSVYPNPVKSDRIVTIKIANVEKSTINLKMISNNGQIVYTKSINHTGGSVDYPIHLDKKILNGNYTIEVSNGNNLKSVIKLVL